MAGSKHRGWWTLAAASGALVVVIVLATPRDDGAQDATSEHEATGRSASPAVSNDHDSGPDPIEDAGAPPHHPELDRLEAIFCGALAPDVCRARRACGCYGADDDPECEAREREGCARWLECFSDVEPESAVVVDPARVDHCVTLARAALRSCEALVLPQDCAVLLAESVEVGGRCAEAGDPCRGGACDDDGICVAYCREGEIADERCAFACAPGLRPDDDRRCVPAAEGRCDAGGLCPPGRACVDGVCARPRRAGEPCDYTEECAVGFDCIDERCDRAPDACAQDGDCGRQRRCGGEHEMRCIPQNDWPLAALGEQCFGWANCVEGATCTEGRCVPAPRSGPCDGACALGYACEWVPATGARECVPATARLGERCDRDAHCAPGLGCGWVDSGDGGFSRQCMRPAGFHQPCPELACAHGLACDDFVEGGRCEPMLCGPESIWMCDYD